MIAWLIHSTGIVSEEYMTLGAERFMKLINENVFGVNLTGECDSFFQTICKKFILLLIMSRAPLVLMAIETGLNNEAGFELHWPSKATETHHLDLLIIIL